MAEYYTVAAKGVPGNDDYGTMSAWLLFAKVGGCYMRVLYARAVVRAICTVCCG